MLLNTANTSFSEDNQTIEYDLYSFLPITSVTVKKKHKFSALILTYKRICFEFPVYPLKIRLVSLILVSPQIRGSSTTKWVYFMTLFVGAAVCIWLILLNARIAAQSSSTGRELEQSEKSFSELKEQLRKAESNKNTSNRKVTLLEQEVSTLKEQRASDRQVLQDL
jgi:hypothetical protein